MPIYNRTCAVKDLEIGEIVLTTYPNGVMGTAEVVEINNMEVKFKDNWGNGDWTFWRKFGKDYTNDLLKTYKAWDEENNE